MRSLSLFCLGLLFASTGMAADVPSQPLGKKGEPLFADDFARAELGATWRISWPVFQIADGVLMGEQTKPTHGAVAGVKVGKKDVIIEFKFRFDGATSLAAVCDDRSFKGSHGGHICRVSMTPTQILLGDDKERWSTAMEEMRKDPQRKAEVQKLTAPMQRTIAMKLVKGQWYRMAIEIVGDEMRMTLDDKPTGYLKSPGLAHPNKSDLHFTVNGGKASFDDLGIWIAEPR